MTASALTRPGQRERLSEKITEIDWRLALILTVIAGIGAMILYSAAGNAWSPWADKHLIRYGLCLIVMLGLSMIGLRYWFTAAYPTYALALFLLLLVPVIGHTSLGAKRWVFGVQPSEIMKVGIVLALARFYHGLTSREAAMSWKLLIPIGLIGVPVLLVAHQPDLGTAILLALTGFSIMVLGGLSWRLMTAALILGGAAVAPFVMFVLKPYQRDRLLTFLHPESDPSGLGYHITQSKIAIGSGGLMGKGFGLGSQSQLNFLPEKQTDFIFATYGEEFGLVGCVGLLALYGLAIAVALRIASISHSHFGRLSAAGVTVTFALYVLVNAAMVMGLAPVVGVPMPLMSYGGSVMVTVMVSFGLVEAVRVHRYEEMPSGRGSLL
ncbi:MAG: rod shape-determining protein RodA [Pseudomonadota bacterium]|nr:rod shape-determining protein RodA [Pseudomonadota bacterium]